MKVKYEDIRHDMFLNCKAALKTALKYDREIDKELLKGIAKRTVGAFMEFYEIDNTKYKMERDMWWYLKGKLSISEEEL